MCSLLIRHELLRNESVRLSTLMYLSHLIHAEKVLIARSGFYYDYWNEIYICFSCNYFVDKKCKGIDMLRIHMTDSPDCWFCYGLDVSIRSNRRGFLKGSIEDHHYDWINQSAADMDEILSRVSFDHPPIQEYNKRSTDQLKYLFCISESLFIPAGGTTLKAFHSEDYLISLRSEERRLETYKITNYLFPLDNFEPDFIDRLAKNGFFYCLTGTNVECAFCRIVLGDLNSETDFISLHEEYSPKCSWVNNERENNIPLTVNEVIIVDHDEDENENINRERMCRCCMTEYINVVHSCGHISLCITCASKLENCIICRQPLIDERKIYF
jgi:hypothetical protein